MRIESLFVVDLLCRPGMVKSVSDKSVTSTLSKYHRSFSSSSLARLTPLFRRNKKVSKQSCIHHLVYKILSINLEHVGLMISNNECY